jgi:hypothetical protein
VRAPRSSRAPMCGLAGPAPPAGAPSCPPLPTVMVTGETRSRAALRFARLPGRSPGKSPSLPKPWALAAPEVAAVPPKSPLRSPPKSVGRPASPRARPLGSPRPTLGARVGARPGQAWAPWWRSSASPGSLGFNAPSSVRTGSTGPRPPSTARSVVARDARSGLHRLREMTRVCSPEVTHPRRPRA